MVAAAAEDSPPRPGTCNSKPSAAATTFSTVRTLDYESISETDLLGHILFGSDFILFINTKGVQVTTFILAFVGGVVPMIAVMGGVPEPFIHLTYCALATILHRLMLLDIRVARLLVHEFEVLFMLMNWLGFFVGMGVLFDWDDRTGFVLVNGLLTLSYCFSDATMVPERRQRAGFITLVVSGIVFTIAVDRQAIVNARYEDIAINLFSIQQTAKACVESRMITLTIFWTKYLIWSIRRPGCMVMLKMPVSKAQTVLGRPLLELTTMAMTQRDLLSQTTDHTMRVMPEKEGALGGGAEEAVPPVPPPISHGSAPALAY